MTPKALSGYLAQLVQQNLHISVMIWGAPGIGKSSIVRQIAEANGLDFIDLRLSQLAPTDLRGVPVPQAGITSWYPPEFLPQGGKGILFLDEINLAPPVLQGIAQQLVLDREVGSYQVPDGWFVWAAGNRKEDRAAVFDMPAPLANRFLHLEVEPHLDNFRHYAIEQNADERVLGFLAFRPSLLHKMDTQHAAWPSPRSWMMASGLLKADLDIAPAVGEGAAAEFRVYCQQLDMIPGIDSILKGKSKDRFPHEPSLQYALAIGLVMRVNTTEQALNVFRWLTRHAPPEWVQMAAADMFPRLRSLKLYPEFQQAVLADVELTTFLDRFTAMSL